MNRRTFLLGTAVGMTIGYTGCRSTPDTYVVVSGEDGGFQDAFARLLAAVVDGNIRLEVRNTKGSLENVGLIRKGEVTFGLSLADSAADDPAGLTALGRVYENYVQLAVRADSGYWSFEDLRGRPVSLGARGSGTEWTGLRVLAAAGMGLDDIVLTPVSLTTVREALSSGRVAAAMWAGGCQPRRRCPNRANPWGSRSGSLICRGSVM